MYSSIVCVIAAAGSCFSGSATQDDWSGGPAYPWPPEVVWDWGDEFSLCSCKTGRGHPVSFLQPASICRSVWSIPSTAALRKPGMYALAISTAMGLRMSLALLRLTTMYHGGATAMAWVPIGPSTPSAVSSMALLRYMSPTSMAMATRMYLRRAKPEVRSPGGGYDPEKLDRMVCNG